MKKPETPPPAPSPIRQDRAPSLPWYMKVKSAGNGKVEIKYNWFYILWLKARIEWRPYRAKLYRAYYNLTR